MKYFSMFSGIGGFELGIQQAYESLDNRGITETSKLAIHGDQPNSDTGDGHGRRTNPTCIGYSEIDKYAIQIYEKHFNHKNYGSATTINPTTLPDFDLICGGFPCQAFSIAGKRGGFDDTRGTLFFDIARIARVKRPRLLFLENVKGLLSHDGGRTFDTIIRTIDELGYDLQWQVLNSKNFGVPQNRERVFIIGHLRGTSRPQVFPIGENTETSQARVEIIGTTIGEGNTRIGERDQVYGTNGIMGALKAIDYKQPPQILELTHDSSQGYRVYDPQGISTTLASQAGGVGAKTGLYAIKTKRTEESKKIRRESMRKGKDWSPFQGKELDIREDELMNTITANWEVNQAVTDGMKVRRLTPTECERLQGFPDGWTEGISDTQRYKCLGNAVTVNVIKAVAEKLL